MLEVVIRDTEPAAGRRRIIGDEDVGFLNQPIEHRAPGLGAQIKREALLVSRVEEETGVEWVFWVRDRAPAIGVAHPGRLDLDDLGAEIRHDRRRRRSGDKARAIDDLEPVENAFRHLEIPFASNREAVGVAVAHDTAGRRAGEMRADDQHRAFR
jgi:hypothetical protein